MGYKYQSTQQVEDFSSQPVGSFYLDKNKEFKDDITTTLESFLDTAGVNPLNDALTIMKDDSLREAYKDDLMKNVTENAFEDPYLNLMPAKIDQYFENSAYEFVKESFNVGNIHPIINYQFPVLKKNFMASHGKDIVLTEVAQQPEIRIQFERKFLKDKDNNKHYFPDIFYDGSYKELDAACMGKAISDKFYPDRTSDADASLPINDLPILTLSGGSIQLRDSLSLDVHIDALKIEGETEAKEKKEVILDNLDIKPDLATQDNNFGQRLKGTKDGVAYDFYISGEFNMYMGTVTVMCSNPMVKQVRFAGHLSNENNLNTIEIDRERFNEQWNIPEGRRINAALTVEKVKDFKALMNISLSAEVISDMSDVFVEFEDGDIMDFLPKSFDKWKTVRAPKFGYDKFMYEAEFSCIPKSPTMQSQSEYLGSELKFRIQRLMGVLKQELKTDSLMFVLYGNPFYVELLNTFVDWQITEGNIVGGVRQEAKFGVTTIDGDRLQVVSTQKAKSNLGLRLVAYPLDNQTFTYKHWKYSFNLETDYRNPLAPNVPNVMGTSKYLTAEFTPLQGAINMLDADFGIKQ